MIERDGRYVVKIFETVEGHQQNMDGRVVHRSNSLSKAKATEQVYREEGFIVEFIDEENL